MRFLQNVTEPSQENVFQKFVTTIRLLPEGSDRSQPQNYNLYDGTGSRAIHLTLGLDSNSTPGGGFCRNDAGAQKAPRPCARRVTLEDSCKPVRAAGSATPASYVMYVTLPPTQSDPSLKT